MIRMENTDFKIGQDSGKPEHTKYPNLFDSAPKAKKLPFSLEASFFRFYFLQGCFSTMDTS